ncbi:NADH-quinone oxidoreductase subunit L [Metabacillus fastidiosus]|uniref:NADH-quinone oxidoreductase subunit L n=1 Tax=Metabacillus fastidiosus TaxID=1458 RepID=UPI002DBFA32D|nr:NADH-quinone oxidoreductase subunit L [Metabacillus fastidiosus]MEC2076031.1 NADH-quinone oxidoreductase subunit L [Metabacillus fastidiosus]
MMKLAFFIPLLPLLSFLILLFGRKLKKGSMYIGSGLSGLAFLLAVMIFFEKISSPAYKATLEWLTIGELDLTIGYEINELNALMLLIVSLISFLVHIYSGGYLGGDERLSVFYAYLGLFTFAMLGLVMTPNLLQLYLFWELVGLGSFLLIGFYFQKGEAKRAAKKAFIMTRIGDVGLFVGMILLFLQVNSFDYDAIFTAVRAGEVKAVTLIAILLFLGAVGKSGQFPLHTWLPDAMEGPTPVSALIHAATMVAAGVYLVTVMYPLFAASETAQLTVAVIGAFTAIFAASIALVQQDIKRVLAYSTMSQLGLMMLALGAAGYVAAVFHLMTHAFFKALLFLAAGSVIHAVRTQNLNEMGGLWKKLKFTRWLFLTGALAITGIPLFSGFFSKEAILISIWNDGKYGFFLLAVIVVFLTACYMFRLFFLIFSGGEKDRDEKVTEAPLSMLIPMTVLALLSIFSGYIQSFLNNWLTDSRTVSMPIWLSPVVTVVSLAGVLLAYFIYSRKVIRRDWLSSRIPIVHDLLVNKYYIDELYEKTVLQIVKSISAFCLLIDRLIKVLVILVTIVVKGIGQIGMKVQSGQAQTYGMIAVIGLAVLAVIFAFTGGEF